MYYLIPLITGYLAGCILTADAVARRYAHRPVWEIGTGNPGMANVMANIGKKEGFLVLAGDILKTLAAALISLLILLALKVPGSAASLAADCRWLAGFGCILGHNYPFWHRFKGGKGVTVTCTWLIITMPVWGTLSSIIGGVITLATGFLPLGAVLIPLFALAAAIFTCTFLQKILILISLLIMLSRHYRGLLRIISGTEEKKFRKKQN